MIRIIIIMMFVVLGSPTCKYCTDAKRLLESNDPLSNIEYTYIDIPTTFGDEWRSKFAVLKSLINEQKSIPIVFQCIDPSWSSEYEVPSIDIIYNSVQVLIDCINSNRVPGDAFQEHWKFIGGYTDLQNVVDNLDISIDNNY
jgi:glutaredoxin